MPPISGTRRSLLTGSAAVAGTGAAVLLPSTAEAAVRYRAVRFRSRHKLLSAADRHLVNRFSYGLTPTLTQQVRRAGGAEKWFEQQLRPGRVSDRGVPNHFGWWSGLSRGPAELWKRQATDVEGVWEVTADYARASLLRRMYSRRQVLEVMTEFWENHLHVPADGDAHGLFRTSYGRTIRQHALGRFDQMLQATTVHPAMLVYLDGAVSTAQHPNENLGRELLEIHTVGRGNYTEADVRGSARILTGWHVDMWKTWQRSYVAADHATGTVSVVGFRHANRSHDGRAVTMAYLAHLARHPATARHLARKLAVKFVRDNPSPALVSQLARVYLKNGTAITPVLRALVASKEFKRSAGAKVRDPGEDLVATCRVLGVRFGRPPEGRRGDDHGANQVLWQASSIGLSPFAWPRPDGPPVDNESWASPSRLIASMQVHNSLAGGWWPKTGVAYRKPRQWLPRKAIRFDQLVDHLSQQLLGRHSTDRLLAACCQAVDVRPHTRITADHGLVKWSFPRLLVTLLDSPTHLSR